MTTTTNVRQADQARAAILSAYHNDTRPWVIGYSGGKDSTAVLRLVYEALLHLPESQRTKPVFVVSSDTLVETPVIVNLVAETLGHVQEAALKHQIPLTAAQVTPHNEQTFWVNLIGKGYPAPTRQFRWCTERMKIDPVSEFIKSKVATFGEVIVVLGSRIAESASRAQVMKRHKLSDHQFSRHTTLVNAYVYTPIENWSADDVWEYLFSGPAPWGGDHQALFDLYKDSNAGECPLVIDKSTPSCGNSRFGCWVCTVVTHDRAIDGLIESGHTWMIPLKDFRNELFETTLPENKHRFRHERRRDGRVMVVLQDTGAEKHIPGAYKMEVRKHFLRKLLEVQRQILTVPDAKGFELIRKTELEAIRLEWRTDPNEPDWEDTVPKIYTEVMGNDLPWDEHDDAVFGGREAQIAADLAARHGLPPELLLKLLEFELSMEGLTKRSQVFSKLTELLSRDWADAPTTIQQKSERGARLKDRDEQERALHQRYLTLEKMLSDAA